ncbi:putative protein KIAA0825 [Channa argus]|uniref:Uncharacterized protein n=1 Tax=Channa argus TaxID=215402 RepID=A0A6G1Q0J4_CHAAH|nr:putative protein KIAA0825 [Channa argus]
MKHMLPLQGEWHRLYAAEKKRSRVRGAVWSLTGIIKIRADDEERCSMEWPGDFPSDHAFVDFVVPGVSSELDIEQLLKSTEEKLNLNAISIEQKLKELQAKMGDSRTGEHPPSPSECLQWFNHRTNNSVRPVTTGHQELMEFFRALQQYLRCEEEGKEELILKLLLNLSTQCGVCFPCTASSSSLSSSLHPQLTASPMHLVHTVRDDVSLEGLRRHSVLVMMHPILTSISGGETGFDRLAIGFRSMVPTLTQAITEELHILSRLTEPHTILSFLNVAYFSTVAQELTSLVERECETALRDNTTLSSKVKKHSVRSRATVAPMDLPVKNRSFSLTSHQLRALTQLTNTLLGFESDVKELVTNMTFINCTGDTPCVKGMTKAHVLEFNWRSAFRGLVPHMEHCVKVMLDDVCTKSLQQEEALHSSGHTVVALSCTAEHTANTSRTTHFREDSFYTYSERGTPKMIAKFCGTILADLDALLPLAAACRDSSLLEVQSSFVEACGRAAFAMLGRLQERALEVPSSAPLKNLPVLLATSVYVRQRLEHYHARLKDSNAYAPKVPLTLMPIQKYQETEEALKDQLTSYCFQVCSTCILQDAESHHWDDPKPFYEGERCSFSVQMWFYFLCGLRSDLWMVLPAELAKEVLGQVLSETLQLLVQRYARAHSSYKRHLQIRTFMINVAKQCTSHQPDSPVIRWLNAVNPDLFTEQAIRDGLMDEAAFACQLRLLTSDPGHNPKLLLRMLLYRDCHLSRILLENSYFCQESGLEMAKESCKAGNDLIVALFNLFNCLNDVPKALTQALQPYLERAQIWKHLYTLADAKSTVPVVISCVRTVVTKFSNTFLVHLVSMVMGWQATEEPTGALLKQALPECVLAKIPREWNYRSTETRGKETSTKTLVSLAIQAMSFIFTNLPLAIASVPLPIRFLFQVAETHLSQHARQLRLVGLLLWAMLGCLIKGLEDLDTLEQISGLALDRGAEDCLSLLAECLQAAMGIQQKGVPKPMVHTVLQVLEEKRPKWTNMQLQKSRKLCSDSMFEQAQESGVAAAELTEQKIGLMLLEVCHKAGGSDYLRQIYHIIQGNEELLMSKLSGSTDSPNDSPHFVNFELGTDNPVDAVCFNPLHQFDHIGKKKLDQSTVVDWAWDWPRLLPTYQGMSQVTFKTLLANSYSQSQYTVSQRSLGVGGFTLLPVLPLKVIISQYSPYNIPLALFPVLTHLKKEWKFKGVSTRSHPHFLSRGKSLLPACFVVGLKGFAAVSNKRHRSKETPPTEIPTVEGDENISTVEPNTTKKRQETALTASFNDPHPPVPVSPVLSSSIGGGGAFVRQEHRNRTRRGKMSQQTKTA